MLIGSTSYLLLASSAWRCPSNRYRVCVIAYLLHDDDGEKDDGEEEDDGEGEDGEEEEQISGT